VKEAAMLDKPALMKKLRGLLGDLSGRVAGRNKDDINDALIAVCFSTLDPQSPIPNLNFKTISNNFLLCVYAAKGGQAHIFLQ
jgi:hypothetical protein